MGALGHGDYKDVLIPTKVEGLSGIKKIDCDETEKKKGFKTELK